MILIPTQIVKNSRWVCLFQLLQFCINVILRLTVEFTVTGQLIHAVIHRGNVPSNQLINASVFFIFNLEFITNAGFSGLIFLEYLNHLDTTRANYPVHG